MSELKYVFSADSHIVEPFDLWTNALGAKHGELLPQEVSHCNGVDGKYFYTGIEYIQMADLDPTDTADSGADSTGLDPELEDKVMRTNSDPALRLELMDLDGVAAEFITSTWMLFSMRIPDMEVVRDCCSVYNDWVAEYCSHDPKRLIASAMIAMEDVDWAVAELEKAAKKNMGGAVIYCDTKPHMLPYRHKHYDRFWAAAQDLNMPVMLHIVTGQVRDLYTLQTPAERELIPRLSLELFQEGGLVLANEFIFGGVSRSLSEAAAHPWRVRDLVAAELHVSAESAARRVGTIGGSKQDRSSDRRIFRDPGVARLRRRRVFRPVLRYCRIDSDFVGFGLPASQEHLPQTRTRSSSGYSRTSPTTSRPTSPGLTPRGCSASTSPSTSRKQPSKGAKPSPSRENSKVGPSCRTPSLWGG